MSTYPDEPGAVAGCDTSEQAAQTIDASSMRRKVRSYVDSQGASGATCDEVEVALEMRHQTASARVRELVLRGELRDSGARRPTRCSPAAPDRI